MPTVSRFRLLLLRGMYLLVVVAMGAQTWPLILSHPADAEMQWGVVRSMLGAMTLLLALLGLRHPLKMLPLLFWELAWKTIWVLSFGVPLWMAGQLTGGRMETMIACLAGVVLFPLVIPWRYVWSEFGRGTADATRADTASAARPALS